MLNTYVLNHLFMTSMTKRLIFIHAVFPWQSSWYLNLTLGIIVKLMMNFPKIPQLRYKYPSKDCRSFSSSFFFHSCHTFLWKRHLVSSAIILHHLRQKRINQFLVAFIHKKLILHIFLSHQLIIHMMLQIISNTFLGNNTSTFLYIFHR